MEVVKLGNGHGTSSLGSSNYGSAAVALVVRYREGRGMVEFVSTFING